VSGEESCEGVFTVGRELGFHLRPAGRFVKLAARYDAEVEVAVRDDEWVSGRSLLALASLGAARGMAMRVRAVGPEAEAAVEALGRLIEAPNETDEP
jgi:phosphocarrier protein HPr